MVKLSDNNKTVTLKIRRIDLCDLILACRIIDNATDDDVLKWAMLHDKLQSILDEFDTNLPKVR